MEPAKKKPSLAVLIGMAGKPKKDGPEEEAMEGEAPDEEASAGPDAAEEFAAAAQSKDWARAYEAFRVLHDLCASSHEETAEEE